MPGRNDPCPCGSGKKYKKCCLLRDSGPHGEATALGEREHEDAFASEDPELAAWKRADKELIRCGMERIGRFEEDFPALMEQYWGKGSIEYWKQNGITEGELQQARGFDPLDRIHGHAAQAG